MQVKLTLKIWHNNFPDGYADSGRRVESVGAASESVPILNVRIGLARAVKRQNFEWAFACDAIGGKVGVVDGEDGGDGLAFREVDESGVGEIHWTIPVARHQGVDVRQFVVVDFSQNERTRTHEFPGRFHFGLCFTNEMEYFG